MKATVRPLQVRIESGQDSEERPGASGRPPERRMRVLLAACGANEVQHLIKNIDRIEVAYLPSYDMEEIREGIERFSPNLILCGAEVFLDTFHAQSSGAPDRGQRDGTQAKARLFLSSIAPREMKVLTMLAKGATNTEIAQALLVSSRTVKRILTGLFERFEVKNRTILAGRATELLLLKHNDDPPNKVK
jgi:DNA-binding NarL/FixJ family response regulator